MQRCTWLLKFVVSLTLGIGMSCGSGDDAPRDGTGGVPSGLGEPSGGSGVENGKGGSSPSVAGGQTALADAGSSPTFRLAWISKGACNTFFDISKVGLGRAVFELKNSYGQTVEARLLEPNDCVPADAGASDAAGASSLPDAASPDPCAASLQNPLIQQAMDAKVDAIAISVSDPTCTGPVIDQAVDAGILVITFDSDAPNSKRQTYFGIDNRAAAQAAAQALAALMGYAGEVAIQTSMSKNASGVYVPSKSASYVERLASFSQEMEKYPEISLVATVPCEGQLPTEDLCAARVEQLLVEHPSLKGLYLARGKLLREANLEVKAPAYTLARQQGRLYSIGFDAPADALTNIGAGYVDAVIAQRQYGWGYDVLMLAYDVLKRGKQVGSFTDSGWDVICPASVAAYAQMWEALDFRQTTSLPACAVLP
jgi:ribose transport system substrate-binding protein